MIHAMELTFVNLSEPSDITTKDARKLVRSQAMLHFRNRQRLQTAAPKRSSPLPKRGRQLLPKGTWQLYPIVDEEVIVSNSQEETARDQGMEEIDRYPISPTQKYNFTIFHHCEYILAMQYSSSPPVFQSLVKTFSLTMS